MDVNVVMNEKIVTYLTLVRSSTFPRDTGLIP